MSALTCLVALGCASGSGGDTTDNLTGGSFSLPSMHAGSSGTPTLPEGGKVATVAGSGGKQAGGSTGGAKQGGPDNGGAEQGGAAGSPDDSMDAGMGGADGGKPSDQVDNQPKPAPGAEPCPDVGLDAPKVHYVCDCQSGADASCKAGDDSAAGSKSAPFKTYGRARQAFSQMNAGETVAFCRGGSFAISGDRRWVNAKCKADQPCVVRDYVPEGGKADLAKPILTASSDHGFQLDDSAGANHEEGYKFLNLDIRSSSKGASGNGFFVYNDVDDVEICGTDLSGFQIGLHAAGSNSPEADSDGKNARVTLSNAIVRDNGDQGYLGGCDGCGVKYSTFINNGFKTPVLDHNIYFGPRGADGMFALYNDLYQSTFIDGECKGVSLVVHGRVTNLLIEGNNVHEDVGKAGAGCWGIAVDTGYAGEQESFENVTIRGNTVSNVGNVSIGLNGCKNCVIENNVVIQEQPVGEGTLIAVADRSRDDNDGAMTDVTVRNNTLFANTTANITGISLGTEGTGHVSVNNALLSQGSGKFTCFRYGLADSAYKMRDNNLCYATNGAQGNSVSVSLSVDPQFVSTKAPYDFTPKANSPLLDVGHTAGAKVDLLGKTRDATPDIGAFER